MMNDDWVKSLKVVLRANKRSSLKSQGLWGTVWSNGFMTLLFHGKKLD